MRSLLLSRHLKLKKLFCNPQECARHLRQRRPPMYEPLSLAWLILALPFAAVILTAIFSKTSLQKYANVPLIVACASAFIFAFFLVREVSLADGGQSVS